MLVSVRSSLAWGMSYIRISVLCLVAVVHMNYQFNESL